MDIKDKKVAVIGLSKRSGVAATKLLVKNGARVIVSDIKSRDKLQKELEMLQDFNLEFDLGGHSEKSLESDLIVVSPGVPLDLPFFDKAKKKGIPVISEVELAYNFTNAGIIAVTGTNGKTTTTSLIGHILKRADIGKVKIAGNIGVSLCNVVSELTADDWIVAEISSFQLETISNFRPNISVYLNFTPDHLDRHHTEKAYWKAKKNIFKNQTKSDYALINIDDKQVVKSVKDCQAEVLGISDKKEVEQGAFIKNDHLMIRKKSNHTETIMPVAEIPLPGRHNIMNVAFAALVSRLMGIAIDNIKDEIINFKLDEHRLTEIGQSNSNVLIVDDSKATNPDAAIKALNTYNRPIVLIAGGQDRNADFEHLAQIISENVKSLVLLGETKNIIKNAVIKQDFDKIQQASNMEEAVKLASRETNKGDCLMLSPGCPSWDMYPSYKKRGNLFQKEVKKHYNFED